MEITSLPEADVEMLYDIYQIGQNTGCAPSCSNELSALRMESFHSTPTVFSHAALKTSIIVLTLKS
jgi:hypothetical protein